MILFRYRDTWPMSFLPPIVLQKPVPAFTSQAFGDLRRDVVCSR